MGRGLLALALGSAVAAGGWVLWPRPSADEGPTNAEPGPAASGQLGLRTAITNSAVIRGRVMDVESQTGLAGVRIDACERGDDGSQRAMRHAVTGPDGSYAVQVSPGEVVVNAAHPHAKGFAGYAGGCLRHRFVVGPNEEVDAPPILLIPEGPDARERGRWGFAMNLAPHAPDHSELVVTWVEPGSAAELGGLTTGDQIVRANGFDLSGFRHSLIWGIVRVADRLELTLAGGRSVLIPSRTVPGP